MSLAPSNMFFRLLLRATTVRRGRTLTALLAMTVAATLATALMNLYSDIGAKLGGDFRKFGANVVMTSNKGFEQREIAEITAGQPVRTVVLPSAFAIARTTTGQPVVVVGTDFPIARQLNSFWRVSRWPSEHGGSLVGARAAKVLENQRTPTLAFAGKTFEIKSPGELLTGGAEDSRVYISLADFQEWTGIKPSVLELAIPGSPADVRSAIDALKTHHKNGGTVQPVRQIVEAETRVLGKTKFILLLSVIAITLTVALCVLATLTASVMERRRDYAIMKALGSSQRLVNSIFLGETFALAVAGALIGFIGGCGLAMWIGRVNFHAAVEPRLNIFPAVFAGCVVVAMISAVVPLGLLQKLEPAVMLKGE